MTAKIKPSVVDQVVFAGETKEIHNASFRRWSLKALREAVKRLEELGEIEFVDDHEDTCCFVWKDGTRLGYKPVDKPAPNTNG